MRRPHVLALLLVAAAGCTRAPFVSTPVDGGPNPCASQPAGLVCFGSELERCDGNGNAVSRTNCAATGQLCAPGVGCRTCVPSRLTCAGESVRLCNADGSALTNGPTCDVSIGEHCSPAGCANLCRQAVTNNSYIGCEYFPTVLPNSELDPNFRYAVVIANPQLVSAQVQIFRGASVVAQLVVPAGGLSVQELDWIDALRGDNAHPASVLARDSTYHLVSDVPVTVTQFNPLRYQLSPTCTSTALLDGCFSYTNDASLLLPAHVLTGSYVVVSRPTHVLSRQTPPAPVLRGANPGFVAIVNVEDHAIAVNVRSTAHTIASLDGAIPALAPGEAHDFMLDVGDVLVLETADPGEPCPGMTDHEQVGADSRDYCLPGPDWDLTGTQVRTQARVAVYGGHDCTFVPYNRWACDHLEQQLFPLESLGVELFAPITHVLRAGEPNLVRVVAAMAPAHVTFEPPLEDGTSAVDLMPFTYTEHELRHDVWIRSNSPILGAMFLVGQNYLGATSSLAVGDPAMSLLVPTEQYRTSYAFLAPDTYSQSYIDVAIPMGAQVYLDGAPITARLTPSAPPMMTGRLAISTGAHSIRADRPFGLYVYGFGSYTSYMYPGGLDLTHIGRPF